MKDFRSKDGYKPTEDEEFMNERMVKYFEEKLSYMREKLLSRDKNNNVNLDLTSLKESDLNDRATIEEETSLDLKNKERINNLLIDIDLALAKIKSGDYGYCKETDEPISVTRLDAIPTTPYSIETVKKMERENGNRPL